MISFDHNERVVTIGAATLGMACGIIGTFLTLRRRALVGDAISHAALPGVACAFLAGSFAKSLPVLLAGGALGGAAGVAAILLLRRVTPLRDDAIVASVLSVFFGAGIVLLSVIQGLSSGHAAGLETFIYGRTASMIASDAWMLAAIAGAVMVIIALLAKELRLLCFDEGFARSLGLPTGALDAGLMILATIVTVAGMQAVGLILVVALQVIPASAARFWSHRLGACVVITALLGAGSGAVGAIVSAQAKDLPSGAMIVLVTAIVFAASMLFGSARGLVWRWLEHWTAARRIGVEHLLRALFEAQESSGASPSVHDGLAARVDPREPVDHGVSRAELAARRRFHVGGLSAAIRRAHRAGFVRIASDGRLHLTMAGRVESERLTARHRLWELYMIERAGIDPTHVDRDADLVEHVLSPELLARIAQALGAARRIPAVSGAGLSAPPPSPHRLDADPGDASSPREARSGAALGDGAQRGGAS